MTTTPVGISIVWPAWMASGFAMAFSSIDDCTVDPEPGGDACRVCRRA